MLAALIAAALKARHAQAPVAPPPAVEAPAGPPAPKAKRKRDG